MAFSMLHLAGLLLLCVLLLPSWPLVFSQADRRIPLGSSLSASHDSSSWPSPSGEFAFGFHGLDGQAHFLLAIWYEKIPEKTLVWYANGGNPAPEGSKVELTSEGQFILSDPKGNKIWEPDSSSNGIIAYALMLDNGNFVLTNGSGNSGYAWESFKSPSDTILPGQILDIGGTLSSRRAEGNYSKGRFQLRLIPDGNFVLNTLDVLTDTPTNAYYWSNTYDGVDRRNAGHQVIFNESGYLYVVRWNGNIVNLRSENIVSTRDNYHRGTLDFDGIFTIYTRPKSPANGSWVPSWSIPKDICSENWGESGSGICGFNTHCILDSNGRPICECLPGFSYIDPSNNFSGCKQDRPQKCEPGGSNPGDIYEKGELINIFWPNSSNFEELRPLENEEDCWKSCLYDCNCIVAIPIGSACEKKRLPLTNGRVDGSTNRKAFIKLPKPDASSCEPPIQNPEEKRKGQATLILVGSFLLGGSVFLNFLLAAAISLVRLRSGQERQKLTGESSILERNIRSFTYKELEEATDGFREVLGRGAFGTVYKGVLSSSSRTHVAVKNLDRLAQERENEFKTEASIIAMTHHKNLVRLLGFCDEGPHKLLVYEFMSNGTLASFLFGDSRPDWKKRMGLAFGIARGIMYLHEECSTQIIHCDIKPQNILLDDSFTARISDFGLAKLLMSDQSRTLTAIRGTKGYVAPEWFRNKPIAAKVDVYSYGVMLLEIISCRKSLDLQPGKEEEAILTDWAYDCYQGGRVEKLVENDEEARNYMRTVERLVMVAIWCIQEDPALRPSMRNVIQMLEGVAEVPVPPCPFPFSSAI